MSEFVPYVLAGWLILTVLFVLLLRGVARLRPFPAAEPGTKPLTFNEHAATALAALDGDAPQNTLSDYWLAYVDSLPDTHEREYTK